MARRRAGAPAPTSYWSRRQDPVTSLALVTPVFLVYHLGILLIDRRNGVDLVTELTFRLLDRSPLAYAAATVAFAIGLVLAAWWLRGRGRVRPAALASVLVESSVLAIVMMMLVGWATRTVFAAPEIAAQSGMQKMAIGPGLVLSAGAGLHEELVFRAGLVGGATWVLRRLTRLGPTQAVVTAVVLSSLAFSAIHYVGPLGDPFGLVGFTFRFLAGVFLAVVYRWRGLAVAVYTHTLYDVLILVL